MPVAILKCVEYSWVDMKLEEIITAENLDELISLLDESRGAVPYDTVIEFQLLEYGLQKDILKPLLLNTDEFYDSEDQDELLWQALMANHAKRNHVRGKSLTPLQRRAHADKRYFTWSAKLTNSIQPRAVRFTQTEVIGEVVASESYAAIVELGDPPRRRAFPFFGPAIRETAKSGLRAMQLALTRMFR